MKRPELDPAIQFGHVEFHVSVGTKRTEGSNQNWKCGTRSQEGAAKNSFLRVLFCFKAPVLHTRTVDLDPHQRVALVLVVKLLSPDGLFLPDWRV